MIPEYELLVVSGPDELPDKYKGLYVPRDTAFCGEKCNLPLN